MRKLLLTLLLCLLTISVNAQASKFAGSWRGQIDGIRRQINFKLHFTQKDDSLAGTIEIQGINLPLKRINFIQPDSIFISFRAGPASIAKFKGSFQTDTLIKGTYYQRGYTMPFKLNRIEEEMNKQVPLPYNHQDLIIHNDSIKIGGTLTWPEDQPTKQLVITISGSGAQNRNEEIYGFKIFGTIADYLTRHGIAVFRYDDRGVGKSTGSLANTTLEMLASDVEAIINYFSQKHDSISSFSNIILLGHSKGGMIAGKVATESRKVDKIILMSSPGVPLSKILNYQFSRLIKKGPFTEEQKQEQIAALNKMIEAFTNDKKEEQARKNFYKQLLNHLQTLPDSLQAKMGNLQAVAKQKTDGLLSAFKLFKRINMLTYHPASDLKAIDIPVLVLFGGKDIQVTVEMNKKPIKQALEKAGVPYEIKVFPNANHLYQKTKSAETPYYALKDEFVNGFLETITRWIKK